MAETATKMIAATADVIAAIGFTNLAKEFIERPADRQRIIAIATKDLWRNRKYEESNKLALLGNRAIRAAGLGDA